MGLVSSTLCLACQGASCACSMAQCCFASGRGVGGLSTQAAKVMYILMLGVATAVALFFKYNGDNMHLSFGGAFDVHCSNDTDHRAVTSNIPTSLSDVNPLAGTSPPTSSTYIYCKGDAAVYRVSFVLTIFFVVVGTLSSVSDAFHRGWWGPKLIAFFGLLIGSFFIHNNVFDNTGYAWVARIASMMFLLLQILALIDFGYQWNESWVDKSEDEHGNTEPKWLYGILASASLLYLFSVGGIIYMFMFYDDCGVSVFLTSMTLILLVAYSGLSLFRDKLMGEDFQGAILPASVVASYCVYLTWSALESNPDATCKPASSTRHTDDNGTDMTIGIVVATVSLMWTTYNASRNAQEMLSGERDSEAISDAGIREPLYRVATDDGDEESGANAGQMRRDNIQALDIESDDGDESNDTRGLWVFHLMMMTASMYMAMLLTNWGANEHQRGNENGSVGLASMWVKSVSGWLTAGLYIWTLVAPRVLPDRDWE